MIWFYTDGVFPLDDGRIMYRTRAPLPFEFGQREPIYKAIFAANPAYVDGKPCRIKAIEGNAAPFISPRESLCLILEWLPEGKT